MLDGVGAGEAPDAAALRRRGQPHAGQHRARGRRAAPARPASGWDSACVTAIEACARARRRARAPRPPAPASPRARTAPPGTGSSWAACSTRPLPTYPDGFPRELIAGFERAIGRGSLGNRRGERHRDPRRARRPAPRDRRAHRVHVRRQRLPDRRARGDSCPSRSSTAGATIARALLAPPHAVGRVIARPFPGSPAAFARTAAPAGFLRSRRRMPPCSTRWWRRAAACSRSARSTTCSRGAGSRARIHTTDNRDGMQQRARGGAQRRRGPACSSTSWTSTPCGDTATTRAPSPSGWRSSTRSSRELLAALRETDLLFITADHGNDPTTPSTDHSREYVPVLVFHRGLATGA